MMITQITFERVSYKRECRAYSISILYIKNTYYVSIIREGSDDKVEDEMEKGNVIYLRRSQLSALLFLLVNKPSLWHMHR